MKNIKIYLPMVLAFIIYLSYKTLSIQINCMGTITGSFFYIPLAYLLFTIGFINLLIKLSEPDICISGK